MQLSLGALSRLTYLIQGGIPPRGKVLVARVLPLLAVLLLAAVAQATPARAASYTGYCQYGVACLSLSVTMADGSAVPNSIPPADEADEPKADEQVELVATTSFQLAPNWLHLQIVDANGNVYADCYAAAPACQVYLWTDKDGRLYFKSNPWPTLVRGAPYGPDGHTVQLYSQIWNATNGSVVVQVAVPVVFVYGDDNEPEDD